MNRSERSTWTAFRTTDLDQAHAHMSAAYMEIRVHRSVPQPNFSFATQIADLGDAFISRGRYRARTRLHTVPFEDPCFVLLGSGAYRVAGPREDYAAPAGGTLLLLPNRRLDIRVDDFRLTSVTLPAALVEDVAHSLADVPDGCAVTFESARPVSKPLEQHWISSVAYVQRAILAHPGLSANPLITGQARRLLAATALTTFPNSTMRLENESPGEVGRAAVRRAIDFIDANPARDVSASDIAAAARLAVPALLQAFRTYLGTTPMAYLRRVRLELAHRDLVDGKLVDSRVVGVDLAVVSITEVARRWGFLDARRFVAEYRRAYGRSPSETLRS